MNELWSAATWRRFLLLLMGLATRAVAADNEPPPAAEHGQSCAMIVAGHPGNALYARHYRDRLTRFLQYFTKRAQIAPARITLLSGDAEFREPLSGASPSTGQTPSGPATAEKILAALATVAKQLKPEDQFILVLLGHGATLDDSCTLMLPGPDLEMKAIGEVLDRIAARNQVVLNFAANSGDALGRLTRTGRVVISSTSPGQVNDTDFADFFLQALEAGAREETTGDAAPERRVSLLTAYNWAALHTAQWTVRQKLSTNPETPGWTVDGKQSADVFQKLYTGADVSTDRRFVASPASEQPDVPVEIVNKRDPSWLYRRLITEMPMLEDLGSSKAASAITDKGYRPLEGSAPAKIGFPASRVVLGDPQLLPVPAAKDK
jgi:hypothetical protein